jgi:hypothetical protein
MEKQRMEKQKAKEDQKDKTKAGYNMFKRLAKFLPKKISSQNNIWRISSAGTPLGLVLGTPTFVQSQESDAKDTKKLLHALEGGSSNAFSSFQKVY